MYKTFVSFFLISASLGAMPNLIEERRISRTIDSLPGYTVLDTILFRVNGSQVILDGNVDTPALKTEAQQRVALLPGVLTVINRLKVAPIAPNDNELRRDAVSGLQKDGLASVHVAVDHGFVTLTGTVPDRALKQEAAKTVNLIPAVVLVSNDLHVAPAHKWS